MPNSQKPRCTKKPLLLLRPCIPFFNSSTVHCLMRKLCLLLFCFCAYRHRSTAQAPENLVFEGAGIRGLPTAALLPAWKQHGVLKNIKRVGGTSAGAITALLLCLNYSATEIKQIHCNTPVFSDSTAGASFVAGGLHRHQKVFRLVPRPTFELAGCPHCRKDGQCRCHVCAIERKRLQRPVCNRHRPYAVKKQLCFRTKRFRTCGCVMPYVSR
jgi:hypothetical protein